ncbi:hypothetical protein BZA05DRAFT_392863 [Tricharina praecox]|uniref:uncharacterized protein n=1 Tax=Tricharina praecox TaxID=43433 RepID=UPI00221FE07E|nr:uncharacterized protein BZA05DRAFT_392863 [Tricharina praecox]KAI5854884.1 hypothetical protein BZA05DRAFT_392863 [Tricharina praecox]
MSDIFHKNDSKIKPKTRGEAGFEFGTSETLQSQDLTDGFYEIPATLEPRGSAAKAMRDHHGGHNPAKAFTSEGAVGKEFKSEGSIGSTVQSAGQGGVLDKNGPVGKQFTSEGKIGGAVDKMLGEKK